MIPSEFKKIPFLEDYYVNKVGQILSDRRGACWINRKPRFLKTRNNIWGYVVFNAMSGGKMKGFMVHRAVAFAFLKKPKHCNQVNHKNGITNDNRLENLEWVTQQQNMDHMKNVLKIYTGHPGEKHPLAKLTKEDVIRIRYYRLQGFTFSAIAKEFNISTTHAHEITSGKSWKERP